MDFSEIIKQRRKELGYTQKSLGEALGTTTSAIQKYELGVMKPKGEMLNKLAKQLDLTVDQLLGYEDAPSTIDDSYRFAQNIRAQFAGGSIPQEDKDAIFKIIARAYYDSLDE